MIQVDRFDPSLFGRWWWTVDRWLLAGLAVLMMFGTLLVAAASPPVAERIGLESFHFVQRHVIMLVIGVPLMLAISLFGPRGVRRIGLALFILTFILLILTPIIGQNIKGATRWIQLPGMSIQPSEFMKPALAIVTAWLFSLRAQNPAFPGRIIATVLYLMTVSLFLIQPDLGQTVVLSAVWLAQFVLAGLPILLIVSLAVMGVGGIVVAYFSFDHVRSRIDRFLDPESGDTYQIDRSIEAFQNGGWFGVGPGQGSVKKVLPDAHADFVFSVAGEEMGVMACIFLLTVVAFIVLRGWWRGQRSGDLFTLLAVSGLVAQIGLQSMIHMASSLHLMPTKGMTFPFVSYGGSSLLALCINMGMVLALTRKQSGRGMALRPHAPTSLATDGSIAA
jgi:cell division protein FtsW